MIYEVVVGERVGMYHALKRRSGIEGSVAKRLPTLRVGSLLATDLTESYFSFA